MLFTLNKKHILSLVILILSLNPIFAGCGSCETKNEAPATKKSSALVTAIPESGIIEGFVITSCDPDTSKKVKSLRTIIL